MKIYVSVDYYSVSMASYEVTLLFVGLAIMGAVALPRILSDKPMSFPLVYVIAGFVLFALPWRRHPGPDRTGRRHRTPHGTGRHHRADGAGLKIDRPFDPRGLVDDVAVAPDRDADHYLRHRGAGRDRVRNADRDSDILLGAVVAPTDLVLASDVQATPPTEEVDEDVDATSQEGTIRFALTSEAGLNDGLAFPFTYLAIAAAAASGTSSLLWLGDWALYELLYKIAAGTVIGYVSGRVFAWFIFGSPASTELARVMAGAEALAATLISYAAAELIGGYGFIAVFVAALVLRNHEWDHDYYFDLHDFAVTFERLLMAAVLVLFGGAIAGGLLAPLTWTGALVGLVVVFVVRPVAG